MLCTVGGRSTVATGTKGQPQVYYFGASGRWYGKRLMPGITGRTSQLATSKQGLSALLLQAAPMQVTGQNNNQLIRENNIPFLATGKEGNELL